MPFETSHLRPDEVGTDEASLARDILTKLTYAVGKDPAHAVTRDWYVATALAVRDRAVDRWMTATRRTYETGQKRVYYLSMEFLVGRVLRDTLLNLGITEACRGALKSLDVEFDEIVAAEPDAGLGNGGLGRLAACFLESMASVGIAAYGYGIRYDYGLFRQSIRDGWQIEAPDDWLRFGNPWEFERPEVAYQVGFGGEAGSQGWQPATFVLAKAYDTPVVGYSGAGVSTLRLWSAEAPVSLDLARFNRGELVGAREARSDAEAISSVLYPDDSTSQGQELRLRQEYFFTSASLQDLVRRYCQTSDDLSDLPRHAAIQLNDTHPALAVPELIRILVDDHGLPFAEAVSITRECTAYTNHTLMPEALERWPRPLLGGLLPRHAQIIERLNGDFLAGVNGASVAPAGISIFEGDDGQSVRMANLAFVGCHKVNGVSRLHTDLMKQSVFHDLNAVLPDRIINQTNGITPRRWLLDCNPDLAGLLQETIGDGWVTDLTKIEALRPFADDAAFAERFAQVKLANKTRLAAEIERRVGIRVDPDTMFDVHVKRMHEYKRQLLNILETAARYLVMCEALEEEWTPRVKIFAGKAAPGYQRAKLIIKLIHDVGRTINSDPRIRDRLKVAFLPNYNVSLAEAIMPAADLSEQISTAGMEASGTGNMKLALNGAVTIGTLDGANVEIRERVGPENIIIFGLTADQVDRQRSAGYAPREYIEESAGLKAVVDALAAGVFSPDDPNRYRPIVDDLWNHDYFMIAADFESYVEAQRNADTAFAVPGGWRKRCVLNTAGAGWFSSDRTIRGYARDIWDVAPSGSVLG